MSSTVFRPRIDGHPMLVDLIKSNSEFHTVTQSFTGKHYNPDDARLPIQGWMNNENYGRLEMHHKMHGIDYVVRSYKTVIAYRTTKGSWHFPTQDYSKTTTRHQGLIMFSVGVLG